MVTQTESFQSDALMLQELVKRLDQLKYHKHKIRQKEATLENQKVELIRWCLKVELIRWYLKVELIRWCLKV